MNEIAHPGGVIVKRSSIIYFGLWLIISFCSFAIHTILAVPPTLVLFIIGTVLLVSFSQKIYVTDALVLPLVCIFYFTFSQALIGAPSERYLGVVLAIGYFLVVVAFGFQTSESEKSSLIRKFINYSILLLIAECAWRFTHPYELLRTNDITDVRWIYQYKFGSFMYSDSNAVGIHIVILFFFIMYLETEGGVKRPKAKLILLILLFLTFSRAAWIGTIIGWVYIKYLRKKSLSFYLINFSIVSGVLLIIYKVLIEEKIKNDPSFLSKLGIAEKISHYFLNASFSDLIFGIGFSNSPERLGIYAHNLFMVFLIESGIAGLILLLLLLIQFVIITNKKALLILVPFIITTLSATITFIPYFYVVMALVYLIEKRPNKKDNFS